MILITLFGISVFILLCLGNCLILGIVHYEKYGQDSKKRSFQDRVFSFNCLLFAFITFFNGILFQVRSLFGPIGNISALIIYFNGSVMLAIPLGYAESILFKCLLIFFWKKFAAINDEFLATFFNSFNVLIGK